MYNYSPLDILFYVGHFPKTITTDSIQCSISIIQYFCKRKFFVEFQVRNISMGQDGVSPNQGVFVEEVEVTAPSGPAVVFPCRCWLAEDEDDGQTTRVLVPGQSLTSRYDSKDGF